MIQEIDRDNQQNGFFLVGAEIEACLDARMGTALLHKTGDQKLKSTLYGDLIQFLIQHNVAGSIELAEAEISDTIPTQDPHKSRMFAAVRALIIQTSGITWPKVWSVIANNDEFGRQIIEAVSYGSVGRNSFIGELTESQLGALYLWMVRHYPYAQYGGLRSGAMSPVDTAVMLRDSILEHLKQRATLVACDALRDVAANLPQYPWLNYHLEEVESLARAATWRPVSPRLLLTLVLDGSKRLIETEQQLIDVVLESLERLNSKLHIELAPVKFLWNISNTGLRPRDEEDVSDYIAFHLDEDLRKQGVIINREVQIRRGPGRGSGQSTDIHVDAVVPGSQGRCERIYAIVEVKGNWHNKLLQAMRTQLRDRYLKENRCRNGIYLVGWFASSNWDDNDYRKHKRLAISIAEAKRIFDEQAADLSTEGYNISSYVLDLSVA